MKIELYYSPGACSFAPHVALIEIGVPFELQKYSTMDRQNYSEEYIAINPKGRIPALSIDGYLLTENPAILTFLGRKFPEANIYPSDATEEEARCLEWLAWCSNTAHVAFAQILRPERFVLSTDDYMAVKESGVVNYKKCLELIEQHLAIHEFALGKRFSVVDPFWLVFYRWGVKQGYDMKNEYSHYSRFIEDILNRASIKEALEREEISVWN